MNGYRADILTAATNLSQESRLEGRPAATLVHLRGLLAAMDGQDDVAIACCRYATQEPTEAGRYHDLGDVLSRKNSVDEALAVRLRAITRENSDSRSSYRLLARNLRVSGHVKEAAAVCELVLQEHPTDALTYGELGEVRLAQARLDAALTCFETALRLDPDNVEHHRRLGRVRLARAEWDLALRAFRAGLRLKRDHIDLYWGVAEALTGLGRLEEAADALRVGLSIDPTNTGASRQLARILDLLERPEHASQAWLGLAEALHAEARYPEAALAHREAIARCPTSLPARLALGRAHLALANPGDAIPPLQSALAQDPYDTPGHLDLGTALHLVGDSDQGWAEFGHHYHPLAIAGREFEQAVWDGSSLDGRTLLLWTEMGRGDVIQFLRYVPFAKDRGAATVVVLCNHPSLATLVERASGVDRVVTPGQPLPPFDLHAPLMFFPALFPESRLRGFGGVPYLTVEEHLVETWRHRLGPSSGFTVGISWGGNAETLSARSRFVPLSAFARLADVPGLRLVSLQHGPQTAELLTPPRGFRVDRVLTESSSIAEAAALLLNVDLVISVDTMIAHLAGALGKPVWLVLRHATNWRWLLHGDWTPWYPTMRLFRQRRANDWSDVFTDVRAALEATCRAACQ